MRSFISYIFYVYIIDSFESSCLMSQVHSLKAGFILMYDMSLCEAHWAGAVCDMCYINKVDSTQIMLFYF